MPLLAAPSRLGDIAVLERPAHQGATPTRTVVLLHGLPTCKEMWVEVMDRLPASWRLLALDLPDFGASSRVGGRHGHPQRAGALRDAFRALELVHDVDLVAHDLGASVAVQYLGDVGTDAIRRVVLLSPPVYPDFRRPARVVFFAAPGVGELLAPLGKKFVLPRTIRQGMQHPERFAEPFSGALTAAFAGRDGTKALLRTIRWGRPRTAFAEYPDVLRGLDRPTLVIHGRDDPWIPAEHARRVCDDVPDAELVSLDDAGHFLPIDVPADVARALESFLA